MSDLKQALEAWAKARAELYYKDPQFISDELIAMLWPVIAACESLDKAAVAEGYERTAQTLIRNELAALRVKLEKSE